MLNNAELLKNLDVQIYNTFCKLQLSFAFLFIFFMIDEKWL